MFQSLVAPVSLGFRIIHILILSFPTFSGSFTLQSSIWISPHPLPFRTLCPQVLIYFSSFSCWFNQQIDFVSSTVSAMRLQILTKDSHVWTRSGRNLTLPCVAKGKKFNLFANPLIWYKVANNGEEFQVCSNKSCLYYLSSLNIDGLCQLHQGRLQAGILSRSLCC